MIDCGADWRGRIGLIAPTAIVLTHAHADHAEGLAGGAPCPVYATAATWKRLRRFAVRDRRHMPLRKALTIGGIGFTAFPVRHSIRAPAVGYRVAADGSAFFYVPDVAAIPARASVLCGIDLYIGDGATVKRSMVRKKEGTLIGHVPVAVQLHWCAKAGVSRAVFTHCGSGVVRSEPGEVAALVRCLGHACGVEARLACDGDRLSLRAHDLRFPKAPDFAAFRRRRNR